LEQGTKTIRASHFDTTIDEDGTSVVQ
jgi:hypothetical protein